MTVTKPRGGLSLLEVLVALAIFLFSLVGIGKLITASGDRAQAVEEKALAIQMCQSKLAEVIAGAIPLSSQNDIPMDEDNPRWRWSMDAEQGSLNGLWNVTIRVSRPGPDGNPLVAASLSQMVLDPNLKGAAATVTTIPTSSSSSQDTSANQGSGTQGGSTTPSAGGLQTPGNSGKKGGGSSGSPSGGGSRPPSGGSTTPPRGGGSSPPAGGNTRPPGGNTRPPSGGNSRGGS
jgi:type II secretion system protein I